MLGSYNSSIQCACYDGHVKVCMTIVFSSSASAILFEIAANSLTRRLRIRERGYDYTSACSSGINEAGLNESFIFHSLAARNGLICSQYISRRDP